MEILFFLRSNSQPRKLYAKKVQSCLDAVVSLIKKKVSAHKLEANVFPAAWCEGIQDKEIYGAVVELHCDSSEALVKAVKMFKRALRLKSVLLHVREADVPESFVRSKVATGVVSLEQKAPLHQVASEFQVEQTFYLKAMGINTSVVLYVQEKTVSFWAVCNPYESASCNYWQKTMDAFLQRQEIQPKFALALVGKV